MDQEKHIQKSYEVDNIDDEFFESLDERMNKTCFQQFAPESGTTGLETDPITGRGVLKNTARSQRTFQFELDKPGKEQKITPVEECHFCQGVTPSTLFYMMEAASEEGGPVKVCDEGLSVQMAHGFWAREEGIEIQVASRIKEKENGKPLNFSRFIEMLEESGPKVLNDMRDNKWLWRSFFNLTPSFIKLPENCVLLASHPEYHYLYLDQFPPRVVASLVGAWKVWEGYVDWRNRTKNSDKLLILPFINGGKRPEAGQTMFCFHSQVYLTTVPMLYEGIEKKRGESEKCPVCEILDRAHSDLDTFDEKNLAVHHNDTMTLCMHPAPQRNFAMIAIPHRRADAGKSLKKKDKKCICKLKDLRNSDVADILQRSVSIFRRLLGKVPAYNISVRCGPEVGHLHIQIIPKTETNILAGYEDLTERIIITQDPAETAFILRRRYA